MPFHDISILKSYIFITFNNFIFYMNVFRIFANIFESLWDEKKNVRKTIVIDKQTLILQYWVSICHR